MHQDRAPAKKQHAVLGLVVTVEGGQMVPGVLAQGLQVGQGVLLSLVRLLQPEVRLLPLPQRLLLHLCQHVNRLRRENGCLHC